MSSDLITLRDPELAAMFRDATPTAGDIPRFVCLGRTEDGRTREEFEDGADYEDHLLRVSIKFASIADVSAHLAHEGRKARAAYLSILALQAVRDKVLGAAGGNAEAPFLATLNAHVEDHERVKP